MRYAQILLFPGGRSVVCLPRGRWREYGSGRTLSGPRWLRRTVPLETIPLYVRQPLTPGRTLLVL